MCRPRPGEPSGSTVGPGGGSAWRGLATMPMRAAVVGGQLWDSTNRAKASAPTDRPRHRRACRTCACSPVAAALRALLWEEAQEGELRPEPHIILR